MASARRHPAKPSEFPILDANALYAADIKGDGNCLFNALSDQLYGHQGENRALRDATIAHMRENADFYRQYMVINPVRRNPQRRTKNRTAAATPVDLEFHTEEELQQEFERHVVKMGQPGEWADNMEVSAFASALNVHVRLWQANYHYTFSPRIYHASTGVDKRPVLNIAYHTWEHYSSVRNIEGPHTGPPKVKLTIQPSPSKKRRSEERDDGEAVDLLRANKRRSPPALFDSDSTPEASESSSDESQPTMSQPTELPEPLPKLKIILKLRNCSKTPTPPQAPVTPPSPPPTPSSRAATPTSTPDPVTLSALATTPAPTPTPTLLPIPSPTTTTSASTVVAPSSTISS